MELDTSIRISEDNFLLDNEKGYGFHLSNGQGWYISAERELRRWADKLAAIMQLKACEPNGYPRLIFLRKQSDRHQGGGLPFSAAKYIEEKLPREGWKARDIEDIRFWFEPSGKDVICEIGSRVEDLDFAMMRYSLYPIYQKAQDLGGLPFHAGLVERDGKGVLLAASRNIGKSTCCRRIPNPWDVLCDEEALVMRTDQEQYVAHPFPTWSDYLMKRSERTWDVQRYVPLSAIFFLERGETDEAIPIGQGEAAVQINNSVTQVLLRTHHYLDREEVKVSRKKLFDNGCDLAGAVPAFKLRVSLKGRFWEEIEDVLS